MWNLYNTNWTSSGTLYVGSVGIEVTTSLWPHHSTAHEVETANVWYCIKNFGREKKRKGGLSVLYLYEIVSVFWCVDLALTCVLIHPVYESKICIKYSDMLWSHSIWIWASCEWSPGSCTESWLVQRVAATSRPQCDWRHDMCRLCWGG